MSRMRRPQPCAFRLIGRQSFACIAAASPRFGAAHGGANKPCSKCSERLARSSAFHCISPAPRTGRSVSADGLWPPRLQELHPRAKIMQQTTREVLNELGVKMCCSTWRWSWSASRCTTNISSKRALSQHRLLLGHHAEGDEFRRRCSRAFRGGARGWIAQWKEMIEDSGSRSAAPPALHGEVQRDYVR